MAEAATHPAFLPVPVVQGTAFPVRAGPAKQGSLPKCPGAVPADDGQHRAELRHAATLGPPAPLLAWAPGAIRPATVVTEMVQNIDVAPTLLEAAGILPSPESPKMDGRSFWPLLQGRQTPWRDHILYEYYWEWNFPATPTTFAIRTDRWKYIYYHGIWDRGGLYDLQTDPLERHNLIDVPAFQDTSTDLRKSLFQELEASGGLQLPIFPPTGDPLHDRKLPR